jgi:hypothetical protein
MAATTDSMIIDAESETDTQSGEMTRSVECVFTSPVAVQFRQLLNAGI